MNFTPPEQSGLQWLFLDLNSYFASVEQELNPALRGRPVAVVPMMTDHTCAIAASYEAKLYGVRTGTIIRDAKRMCPKLVCVPAQHDQYVIYHHKILDEVIRHTPINKIWSIDELSSRLPPNKRNVESATTLAHRIKMGLRDHVGTQIKCSIGIAPNSFLAKVATDMKKPDGLVILEPETMAERLFALKLTDLPGINVAMNERLKKSGITSVESLWHTSPKHARRIWGSVAGERFWYNLRGYDVPDTETDRSVFGHSRILDPALRRPDAAREVARRLLIKAATRLRREEFFAARLNFSTRIIDPITRAETRWAAEARLPPAQDNFSFLRAFDDMWDAMMDETHAQQMRKVSVSLYKLCRADEITNDLFDTISPTVRQQTEKDDALSAVMDKINTKYGAESLRLGVSPKTQAGFVGTKIAFSRVPDLAEFSE